MVYRGHSWLQGFFKRHPRLSERSSRIYATNRVTGNDETPLKDFYDQWEVRGRGASLAALGSAAVLQVALLL